MPASARVLLLLLVSLASCRTAERRSDAPRPAPPHYLLDVTLEPVTHRLAVSATIVGLGACPEARLFLNKGFRIESVAGDGKALPFTFDVAGAALPYVEVARPLVVHGATSSFEVRYSGQLDEVVDGVNQLDSHLVELAVYSAWYPLLAEKELFTWELRVRLPPSFVAITNGEPGASVAGVTSWKSREPVSDVAFVASPDFRHAESARGSNGIDFFFVATPSDAVQADLDALSVALEVDRALFGEPGVEGRLRVVKSPRAGWGYSRLPLIVVSEARGRVLAQRPFGREWELEGAMHELGHFWWSVADVGTPDDWINEGFAEFSAFSAASQTFGRAFREHVLATYRADAVKRHTAVLETDSASPDRHVNRYEKPTLALAGLEARLGRERVGAFARRVFAEFKGTRRATTARVLELASELLGDGARRELESMLRSRDWPAAEPPSPAQP